MAWIVIHAVRKKTYLSNLNFFVSVQRPNSTSRWKAVLAINTSSVQDLDMHFVGTTVLSNLKVVGQPFISWGTFYCYGVFC